MHNMTTAATMKLYLQKLTYAVSRCHPCELSRDTTAGKALYNIYNSDNLAWPKQLASVFLPETGSCF